MEQSKQKSKQWLEAQLAAQCAPLLAGLKPSNLLIVPDWTAKGLEEVLKATKFSFYCMSVQKGKVVFLVYRLAELTAYLTEFEVQKLLKELGYDVCDLYDMLGTVSEKYEAHLVQGTEFPHELGLLLGYPVVDVQGFMKHGGKNFLYSGYWKVYGNLSETKQLFYEFGQARHLVGQLYLNGYSILDIIEYYQERKQRLLAIG